MKRISQLLIFQICILVLIPVRTQNMNRRLGKFQEVYAWRQLTYNIDGVAVNQDQTEEPQGIDNTRDRSKRQSEIVFFDNSNNEPERDWNQQSSSFNPQTGRPWRRPSWNSNRPSTMSPNSRPNFGQLEHSSTTTRPSGSSSTTANSRPNLGQMWQGSTTVRPSDENGRFFIQYNNVPMGVERVEGRLFVTVPRRRYGIPSTLNYIDLNRDSNTRSPALRPYPNMQVARSLTSVYRTRADQCGRLWMVDTGMLEIPNSRQQVQPPAIVVFDLNTDRQIFRYPFKATDIPAENTPTGLASITVDITNNDCDNAFAYVPDLTTFGLIVYSLRENDSWRLSHNFFSFNPVAGNLNIAGQRFQWSDGIFSITLAATNNRCKVAYFHPLVSTHEFSVSTCVLQNRTAGSDPNFWSQFSQLGDRGDNSQSTMHDFHRDTGVIFYGEVARDAISCWNTANSLSPTNIAILAQDSQRLSYPSDLHVSGDEVWVMSNSLPRFGYSRLNTDEYNFFVYKGNVREVISGTVCEGYRTTPNLGSLYS